MATPFQTEAWTERKIVGFNWQGDGYFAVLCLVFWTPELVMLELIGQNGTNIGITDEIGATLTAEKIAKLELETSQQRAVKWTAISTIFAYVGVILVIWRHFTPVHKNWQVIPFPGDQCTVAVANYLCLVVLNISTDMLIVSIPLPLLWAVKLNFERNLAIGMLLCSGMFVMIAALLRCVLSLRDINGINVSTIWAIRETFVGIIAVNAACIRPLFPGSRWLGSSKGSSDGANQKYTGGGGQNVDQSGKPSKRLHNKYNMTELDINSREEQIVMPSEPVWSAKGGRDNALASNSSGQQGGIVVTTTYEVKPENKIG
ncbi:uncharacterized protein LY79DRAFT_696850 [Colletotrichum navitas]|uniref:Rhodopsin domain-containing protein n=1 Tax=Colletotrichum navitas TaxID=681940 RepID=A0AAD8PP06_9PEZI|nr:uncharacterized protein LY79DRAFT_696850 [Colletotrichum navitas]KAK1573744.1 hypothetical protein LY79DRAFT_696850 [Colletotrichum navitas]